MILIKRVAGGAFVGALLLMLSSVGQPASAKPAIPGAISTNEASRLLESCYLNGGKDIFDGADEAAGYYGCCSLSLNMCVACNKNGTCIKTTYSRRPPKSEIKRRVNADTLAPDNRNPTRRDRRPRARTPGGAASSRGSRVVAPTKLSIGSPTARSLKLFWQDNSTNENSFIVEKRVRRRRNGRTVTSWTTVKTVNDRRFVRSKGRRSSTLGKLRRGTSYCLRIRATRGRAKSKPTNTVCKSTTGRRIQ